MKYLNICLVILVAAVFASCGKNPASSNGGGPGTTPGKYTVKINVRPDGSGTITPSVNGSYSKGKAVTFQAHADSGFKFEEWLGDLSSTDSTLQVQMNKDYNLTALFKKTQRGAFYLANNGITIKCPAAKIGAKGTVNGIPYTKRKASKITPANASSTCTSGITSMLNLFAGDASFNADISSWDVSNVTNMQGMFAKSGFNGDISEWDVSNVTNMSFMFWQDKKFDQPLNNWDVGNVTTMTSMLDHAISFNQPLNKWDVGSVIDMNFMFSEPRILINRLMTGMSVMFRICRACLTAQHPSISL